MALFYRPIQRYMRAEFNDSFVTFVLPSLVRLLLAFAQAYKQNHTETETKPSETCITALCFYFGKTRRYITNG